MPRAIIAPSVLASDFGQLTAECQRMIKNGAEWLHMGYSIPFDRRIVPDFLALHRRHGRVMPIAFFLSCSCFIECCSCLQAFRAEYHHGFVYSRCSYPLNSNTASVPSGAPILTCVHKGVPEIFMDCHMMVSEPEKVRVTSP